MQRLGSIVVGLAIVSAVALAGGAGIALAQEAPTPTPSGNTTDAEEPSTPIDQHDDPRNVSEQGDIGQLSDWLGGHLGDRLENGVIQLSQGQYDSVEGLLGDEFESRLSQYVDVAGETNAETDDRAADTVETVADDQREFTDDVQQYRETLAAYREAREQGNNDPAREYARDLQDLAQEIRTNGADIHQGYDAIANATGQNLTAANAAVTEIVTNVSTTQEEIRQATFVETELTVTANRSVARFDRPARIDGRLVAENRSALADRSITVQVGNRNYTTRTDAMGRFSVTYRPVTIASNVDAVAVTYRPQSASVYLGTTENASLSIESVAPTVELSAAPNRAAFGEAVAVEATTRVDGKPVPGVSVGMGVNGWTLARSPTTTSGAVRLAPSLPAAVRSGERSIGVVAGRAGTAIEPTGTTASVVVETTATNLSVATQSVGGNLRVTGTLETIDGRPVSNQTIEIDAGAASTAVTTNANGGYSTTLNGANVGETGDRVTVSAAFDGRGTNLVESNASTTTVVPTVGNAGETGDGNGGASPGGVPWLLISGALVAVVVLGGVIVAVVLWDRSSDGDEHGSSPTSPATLPESGLSDSEVWFEGARAALDRGDERGAVSRAYAASYAGVQERLDIGDDRTPRELLAAADGRVDRSILDALASVADAYERMAFAGSQAIGASEVLEHARVVLDSRDSPRDAEVTEDD